MERNLAHVALFAALIAVLGLIPKLTLAMGVPITAQSLGVMLCGTVLGARRGALAVLLLLLMVALGLPLLAGGRGGLGVFAGPTVGFLVGWVLGAFAIGWLTSRLTALPLGLAAGLAAAIGGIAVMYVPGILGMMVMLDMTPQAALAAVLVFVPGDLIKAVLAGAITASLARARPGVVATRPLG